MAELNCYTTYTGCEYRHEDHVPSGRIRRAKNDAILFCHLPPFIFCVTSEIQPNENIQRLKDMGFNKFIINSGWEKKERESLGLDNSEIMLDLSVFDARDTASLGEKLEGWINGNGKGFAGGKPGSFFAVFLDEPHKSILEDPSDPNSDPDLIASHYLYLAVAKIVHSKEQYLALGEYINPGALGLDHDFFSGRGPFLPPYPIINKMGDADILFYTGYDGPWYSLPRFLGGIGDSDQRGQWEKMKQDDAVGKPAFPFILLSHTSGGKLVEYTDVDYLDTLLGTAKQLFNGAAAYPFQIRDEFILELKKVCYYHEKPERDHGGERWERGRTGGGKSEDLLPGYRLNTRHTMDGLEDAVKKLVRTHPAVVQDCICDRYDNFVAPNLLSFFTIESGKCDEKQLPLLQEAYCELFWKRLELFCAAAERQGLLESVTATKTEVTMYYCAKGDCAKCSGTNPLEQPDLWLRAPLPRCPTSPGLKLDPD